MNKPARFGHCTDPSEIRKIAIVCLAGLGNIILFTPALMRLHAMFPKSEIYFLTIREANYEFLKACPFVQPVLLRFKSERDNWGVLDQCRKLGRKLNFDLSLTVFPANRVHNNIVALLLGAKFRIGFDYGAGGWKKFSFLQNVLLKCDPALHDVEQNLSMIGLLETVFCGQHTPAEQVKLRVWSLEHQQARGQRLLEPLCARGQKIIAFHTVCFPDMKYKRWPPEYFSSLIDLLFEKHQTTNVLLGAEVDKDELFELARLCRNRPEIIVGEEIGTVGEFLQGCDAMVSNDSGLMHLAAAAGIKTVGIFGPTMDSRTRPWGKDAHAIVSGNPYRPCRLYPFASDLFPQCCDRSSCLREITPEQVLAFMEQKLWAT